MSNYSILFKEELDYIIKSFKEKKTYSQIGKQLGKTPQYVKNEINRYIKEKNHSGTSIYKLSKEFDLPLDKIKNIIDETKMTDINYLEKEKVTQIYELLKSKKKYAEIASMLNTSKDTVVLYFKRNINEQINNGVSKEEISKQYSIKNTQIDKLIGKPKTVIKIKKKSKIELLEEENKKLKEVIKNLKKEKKIFK